MQEAYHPPRSKYMLCCSSRGYPLSWDLTWTGGTPLPGPGKGVPPPGPGKGVSPTWTWEGGNPLPGLGRGYPPPGPGKGIPPTWTWEGGTPPTWTWAGGTPPAWTWEGGNPPAWTWKGVPPPRPGEGDTPPSPHPPTDVNRQMPVKTVSSLVLRTRAVIITTKSLAMKCFAAIENNRVANCLRN